MSWKDVAPLSPAASAPAAPASPAPSPSQSAAALVVKEFVDTVATRAKAHPAHRLIVKSLKHHAENPTAGSIPADFMIDEIEASEVRTKELADLLNALPPTLRAALEQATEAMLLEIELHLFKLIENALEAALKDGRERAARDARLALHQDEQRFEEHVTRAIAALVAAIEKREAEALQRLRAAESDLRVRVDMLELELEFLPAPKLQID